jgi:Esterase-like activity of phytase
MRWDSRTLAPKYLLAFLSIVLFTLPLAAAQLQGLEPSGIVSRGGDTLYVVSDNGKILEVTLDLKTDPVTVESSKYIFEGTEDKSNDFEGVAIVPGKAGFLYVGVEGVKDKKTNIRPSIKEFNITDKKFTGNVWELKDIAYDDNSGMESLTFVPDRTASKKGLGGYFLAAGQKDKKGEIYVYDLPVNSKPKTSTVSKSFSFSIKQCKTSDLYYFPARSVLYVAFDEPCSGKPGRAVWEYKRVGEGKKASYGLIAQTTFGKPGKEAITVVEKTAAPSPAVYLYLGFDTTEAGNKNRVDLYQPYEEYPRCGGENSKCSDINGSHCGWCASDNKALYGSFDRPQEGKCQNWIWKSEQCDACKGVTTCKEIDGHHGCGWCKDPQQAMPGTKKGPTYEAGCKGKKNWVWEADDCTKN